MLVAWKSSREAARAVNDALPLLREARSVTVLAINPESGVAGDGDTPAADIALHLARHGVKAEAAHTVATTIPEGDALLNYAATCRPISSSRAATAIRACASSPSAA